MSHATTRRITAFRVASAAALVATCILCGWHGLAAALINVSQQARMFHPDRLEIAKGDTVAILNDDGELLHHAYVESDTFSYDSGEQNPGSISDIRFTKSGTFTVRCRIHPRMALIVTVK